MTTEEPNWYYYFDEELFEGPYPSREAAIEAGLEYAGGPFHVQMADKQDYCLAMTGGEVLEALYGFNEDLTGDEYEFIEPTKEQESDLGIMVTAAIHAWIDKHNIETTAWALDVQGEPELIQLPESP